MPRRQTDAARQVASLGRRDHRPWPLPSRPWVQGQTWEHLLFAHWPVDHDLLRPHVPPSLVLEQWGGSAWLGLTPFRVVGFRLRGLPPLPVVSEFLELNCRTYVRRGDRPGVWFFSLNASSRLAVAGARRAYGLPYDHARISADARRFELQADGGRRFSAEYSGLGNGAAAAPGTLEHFLTERYCLYGRNGRALAEIHHPPWPLQLAQATIRHEHVSPVPLSGNPLCHYAARQDVLVWPPRAAPAA
jgi:uncharacterized protein YqjF (DUF2071 family)